MDENSKDINFKNRIMISRNTPVALVVGAAGFLGSNLVEKLLEKGVQVVGVDNFSRGRKENLDEAIKNNKFHLIDLSAQELSLDLPRLDYIFIVASDKWNIDNVLKLFLEYKSRCLFVSWIDLYDKRTEELEWFKKTESEIAKFASNHKLNARVLRLGPVFGPKMHFDVLDPTIRLIQAALLDDIQKENTLEFSSRALYVNDAIDLIIKSIFAGSTAQKIFDGVLPTPVKVSEIKQVLLDPVWYDQRNFVPSELPPWTTPNLEKTIKFLNWKPKVSLVEALRNTLSYFRDNEIRVPQLVEQRQSLEESKSWRDEKKKEIEGFKEDAVRSQEIEKKKSNRKSRFKTIRGKFYVILGVAIIIGGLVFPAVALGWGVASFRFQLQQASSNLAKGEFDKSLISLAQAKVGIEEAKSIIDSLDILRKTGFAASQFDQADGLITLASSSVISIQSAIRGVQSLYLGLRSTTGDIPNPPFEYFANAKVELEFADNNLSSALAFLKSEEFRKTEIPFIKLQILRLVEHLENFDRLIKKGLAASIILPKIVSSDKNYLILLQNNMELRPGGGFIGSYALISFEGGKLKKLEVNDIYAIDGQLKIHVEPPKEIKEDLGQKDWFLRDSNFEPDFPTSAKQAEWFFNQETGTSVAGVLAFDVTAMENLLEVLGPLELTDYNETITSDNLFEKAVTHSEQGFFPGSQAKKSFLTALTNQLFNKLFFLPNQNWPAIVQAFGKSMENKHMVVFLDDPKLLSYLVSQNWTGSLPRPPAPIIGQFSDFLAPVEANFGANKANYYLDRNFDLTTVIGREGDIKHRLKINYTNRSPSDTWPAGKYKNRLRIYLPFGAKLVRVLWGETDVTGQVSSFVDFGRSGYSMLLEVAPKQLKSLILDYELGGKLEFKDGITKYRLDIIKQAGTLNDPFNWKITYPINYKIKTGKSEQLGPQEQIIGTDLSKDRSFEVEFSK